MTLRPSIRLARNGLSTYAPLNSVIPVLTRNVSGEIEKTCELLVWPTFTSTPFVWLKRYRKVARTPPEVVGFKLTLPREAVEVLLKTPE
jgi:hypothetical protein